jgi:hypothetical protein
VPRNAVRGSLSRRDTFCGLRSLLPHLLRAIHHSPLVGWGHASTTLRHQYRLVSQDVLQHVKVATAHDPVAGERVPQVVEVQRSAVPHSLDFSGLNPGYIDVRGRRNA